MSSAIVSPRISYPASTILRSGFVCCYGSYAPPIIRKSCLPTQRGAPPPTGVNQISHSVA